MKVGDKVKVSFPNGRVEVGTIAEIKLNGWCDIDFGGDCISHDIPQDRIEPLIPISEEEIRKREEELDKEEAIENLNPDEHKINLPISEDAKWEAVGRGYASVLMEKQARIDRLERLIWMLHENICKDVRSCVLDENDMETQLVVEILRKYKNVKSKLYE